MRSRLMLDAIVSSHLQAGLKLSEVEMENVIEQKAKGEEQWQGYSNYHVSEVSSWMSKALFELNVQNYLGKSLSTGAYIQADGLNIRFGETDYGCEMAVFIFKKNEASALFRELWKMMVNNGSVWGGPYKKALKDETQPQEEKPFWKPWEHILESTDFEKRLISLWCTTDKTQSQIADEVHLAEAVVANYLHDLRDKYRDAKIPLGKREREKFLRDYEVYKAKNKQTD